jgi:hypothetical protein
VDSRCYGGAPPFYPSDYPLPSACLNARFARSVAGKKQFSDAVRSRSSECVFVVLAPCSARFQVEPDARRVQEEFHGEGPRNRVPQPEAEFGSQAVSWTANIVADLHRLPIRAGIRPPLLLVWHSMGGLDIKLYRARCPSEVVGMTVPSLRVIPFGPHCISISE